MKRYDASGWDAAMVEMRGGDYVKLEDVAEWLRERAPNISHTLCAGEILMACADDIENGVEP